MNCGAFSEETILRTIVKMMSLVDSKIIGLKRNIGGGDEYLFFTSNSMHVLEFEEV